MTNVQEISNANNELKHHNADCCHELKQAEKHVAEAKAGVTKAIEDLQKAEHDLEQAEQELEKAIQARCDEFDVFVLYDGVKKPFKVKIDETVAKLREEAIKTFGATSNPHLLGLFKEGKELSDKLTIKEAGVEACDVLLLRPSEVRGGK